MAMNYKNPKEPANALKQQTLKPSKPVDDLKDYTKGISMPADKKIAKVMKKK